MAELSIYNGISPRPVIAGYDNRSVIILTDKCGYKNIFFFFDLKSVPISSIQLKFMMRKCDLEAIITKTQETLDRVDEWRGILLL